MDEVEQEARREEIITAIAREVQVLLDLEMFESGRTALASLALGSNDNDASRWFTGENFAELAELAKFDRKAYRLACSLAAQSVINDGMGIPDQMRVFVFSELMKFDGIPSKKRGPKPTADDHLASQIVSLARKVARNYNITFYPNEANPHDFTACHIVAETLTRLYAGGRERTVPEKHRRFKASWIKEMSKSR